MTRSIVEILAAGQRLNDAVLAWHESPCTGIELHQHLGMTWPEYQMWAGPKRQLRDDSPWYKPTPSTTA